MAFSQKLKLIVATDGLNYGMKKDGSFFFGTVIPNYVGYNMTLVKAFYTDGTDIVFKTEEKIEFKDAIKLTTAVGVSYTLTWSDLTKDYRVADGTLLDSVKDHMNGVMEFLAAESTLVVEKKYKKSKSKTKSTKVKAKDE